MKFYFIIKSVRVVAAVVQSDLHYKSVSVFGLLIT